MSENAIFELTLLFAVLVIPCTALLLLSFLWIFGRDPREELEELGSCSDLVSALTVRYQELNIYPWKDPREISGRLSEIYHEEPARFLRLLHRTGVRDSLH